MSAIELRGLTKRFGSFTAVDDVSFEVQPGTIFGFLGPNGSGKSTCMRMLCGVLEPTAGDAVINGFDVRTQTEQVKRSIGYMSQSFSLYRDLTVDENLDFFGGIYGLRNDQLREGKRRVVDLLGLEPYLDRRSAQLSGGWKQRLALGAALIHEPQVVFLDEPTAGIDPVARRELWDLLFTLSGQGKTFFVSTHYMDEAERCDEIAYIYLSKLVFKASPNELKKMPEVTPPGTKRVAVAADPPSRALARLREHAFVLDATMVEAEVHLLIPSAADENQIRRVLEGQAVAVHGIRNIEPSLEDVFVTVTRRLGAK